MSWLAVALVVCARAEPAFETRAVPVMSTLVTVSLPEDAIDRADLVFDAFRAVEATANEWRDGSELARVNAAAGGDAVAVAPATYALVARGVELGARTGGAFDITWAALWGLWDFKSASAAPPPAAAIDARLPLIGYARVELGAADHTVRLPEAGMKLGLGGIAKGRALDDAARALRAAGISDFMMSAGGQVVVGGTKGGRPWRVGIRDPRGPADDFFAVVDATDTSVSTSGDYEHFFEHEGVRYHHILDPRTGRPARGLRSATVVAADATLADALSTALFAVGRVRGLELAQELQVEAVLVDDAGAVWSTPGLDDRLVRVHDPR